MTTGSGTAAAAPYLAAVAAALADVPESERAELLDDLAGHLEELEAEHGDGLAERLGSPSAYATELVASMGLDSSEPTPPAGGGLGIMARVQAWSTRPTVARAGRFAADLGPGWWVARAWLACVLVAVVGDGDELFPIPDVLGNPLLSILALVGAIVVSVRIGRAGGWVERTATAVGVVGLAVALTQGQPRVEYVYPGDTGASLGYLSAPDGRPIWNIWPYDGAGNPLAGVLLFDQDGVPLSTGDAREMGLVEPGQLPIPGLFPLPQSDVEYDPQTGAERRVPVEPPVVSIPRLPLASTTTLAPAETTVTTAAGTETTEAPAP